MKPRLGICTFSCHQHWGAVQARKPGTKFSDAPSFWDYVIGLGAQGVQMSLRGDTARAIRERVEKSGFYYEGDLRLPKSENELAEFETNVRLTREAGATVFRTVLTGNRRYEAFKSLAEFREFQKRGEHSVAISEPILKKHKLRLALENHKDQTLDELLAMMRRFSNEWIGVNVDTGNNISFLDEPHEVVEALAPFAASVHLKDMSVQPYSDGFLMSEVPLGTGFLDLPRIVSVLRKANPGIAFNLEMGTRDPLKIPCLQQHYWEVFEPRKASELARALAMVKDHPLKQPAPSVSGKETADILVDEEKNNRASLKWMHQNIA